MTMMTCKQLVEWVTEYLEGKLPDAERARFDEHLELCPGCRDYLAQFRATIRLTGQLPDAADGIPGETRRRLLRWQKARPIRRRLRLTRQKLRQAGQKLRQAGQKLLLHRQRRLLN